MRLPFIISFSEEETMKNCSRSIIIYQAITSNYVFYKNMPTVQKNHLGEKLRESRSPGEANSVFGGKDKVKLYRGFAPDIFRHKTTSLNAYRSAKLFLCRKNIHCKFLPPLLVLKEITRKCFPSFIHTILMVDTRWLLLLAGCCCCWLSIE